MNRRLVPLPTLVATVMLLTACGEPNGASLLPVGGPAGSGVLSFSNGMAAYIVIGQPDFTSNAPGCGPANLSSLKDTLLGASGKVWLADGANNRVLALNALPASSGASFDFAIGQNTTSSCLDGTAANQFDGAQGVAESGNQLFIADGSNRRVQVFSPIPTASNPSAIFSIGSASPNSAGAGSCDAANIGYPSKIFATATYLYVPDELCNRLLIYALPITGNQPTPVRVLGQSNLTGSASATTQDGLTIPTSVWSDDTKIAVVDAGNHRVLLWNSFPTSDGQAADLVIGQANFTSGSAGLSQNQLAFTDGFRFLGGVFFTGQQFFVADAGNNRVLIWNAWPSSNGQNADTVLGQSGFGAAIGGTSQTALNFPVSVKVRAPYLYVSDADNYRMMVWRSL